MAKRGSSGNLTPGEKVGGAVLFVFYAAVLPFAASPLLALLGRALDVTISQSLGNLIIYYTLFAATLVVFHHLIGRTSGLFVNNLGGSLKTLAAGIVAFYGLNELTFRLVHGLFGARTNLNDVAISARISAAPRTTVLIVVALAPFVEEVLFRGLVLGGLRHKSRLGAYAASCALFALAHVWQYALGGHDVTYLVLALEYLAPGLVFCWAYEHSGTLWTSILLHAAVNAVAVGALL